MTINDEPSMTQEQFQEQSDINYIMSRYEKTGEINLKNSGIGKYMNIIGLPDYKESLELINAAADSFMELPAIVRKRFSNDPAELIEFLQDKTNKDEAISLGLIPQPPPPPLPPPLPPPINPNPNPNPTPKENIIPKT